MNNQGQQQSISVNTSETHFENLEDSLMCPLCIDPYDMNLEAFMQAQARRAQASPPGHLASALHRLPLLSPESSLPVSCSTCWYTFCNACLHRLSTRPGGMKCPICPNQNISAAEPPVNLPLVHLFRLIKPIVEAPRAPLMEATALIPLIEAAAAAGVAQAVTPEKNKEKTVIKAKKSVQKKKAGTKQYVGTYTIQAIVERRVTNGKTHYRVRWEGYDEQDDTWESWTNLKHLDAVFLQQMKALDDAAVAPRTVSVDSAWV